METADSHPLDKLGAEVRPRVRHTRGSGPGVRSQCCVLPPPGLGLGGSPGAGPLSRMTGVDLAGPQTQGCLGQGSWAAAHPPCPPRPPVTSRMPAATARLPSCPSAAPTHEGAHPFLPASQRPRARARGGLSGLRRRRPRGEAAGAPPWPAAVRQALGTGDHRCPAGTPGTGSICLSPAETHTHPLTCAQISTPTTHLTPSRPQTHAPLDTLTHSYLPAHPHAQHFS